MSAGIVMLQVLAEFAGSVRSFDPPRLLATLTYQEMKFLVAALLGMLFLVAINGLSLNR